MIDISSIYSSMKSIINSKQSSILLIAKNQEWISIQVDGKKSLIFVTEYYKITDGSKSF